MKTDQILAWAVIIIVVVIGVWYFSTDWSGPAAPSEMATTTEEATTSPSEKPAAQAPAPASPVVQPATPSPKITLSGFNTVNYLLSIKKSAECAVDGVAAGVRRTGTVYVAGGKLRGDFSTVMNGKVVETHMLADGKNLYAWTEGQTTGIRLVASQQENGSVIAAHGGFDPATSFSFKCADWTADASVFLPPEDVTFS